MKYTLEKYDFGYKIRKINDLKRPLQKDALNPSRRGLVTKFSEKSTARLRDFLLTHSSLGDPVAITLTLPYNITPFQWRELMHRFSMRITRHGLTICWRVELQRRGVPHLHCIGFANCLEDIGNYWADWVESAEPLGMCNHPFFLVYGFCIRYIRRTSWLVYMLNHTAKHKESQLGWIGRQWGIVNRKMWFELQPEQIELDETVVDFVRDEYGFDLSLWSDSSFTRFGHEGLEKIFEFEKKVLDKPEKI